MDHRRIILLVLSIILFLSFRGQSKDQISVLTFNQTFELHLQQYASKQYSILVPQRQSKSSDLFIHAMPKYSDPFQMPYLTINSNDGYKKECFNAATQFAGICHIESQDLTSNRTFNLTIKCATSCDLIIHIYQSPNVILQLGSNLKLTAYAASGLTQIIQVNIPKHITFTSLAITAMILNLEQSIQIGDEGVDLFINYGQNTIKDPQQNQYQLRGESLNGAGKGAFIYINQTNTQDTIKCLVKVKKDVSIRFSIASINDNQHNIDFGKSYFDYVSKESPKIYSLNTASYNLTYSDKTLEIVFDIYSGNPDFLIAFDPNFTNPIQYNRKISAVSILLPPQIRKKFNSTDMVYIKVTSQYSSQYYFYTKFIRDDVTFIQPYLAYLDEIPKGVVQNYILTQTYKYPQYSTDTIKNYSFKIQVIEGHGTFYFKRCKPFELSSQNMPSFKSCLVQDPSYFTTNSFYSQQIQNKNIVNGNLLTITMLYDVSKCTQQSKQDGFIIVKCSYHIAAVGETDELFQFSLLPERNFFVNYLRENKVIKQYIPRDNYAYYVFSLPQIEPVSQINIFVTTFSGDTALIVSSTERLPTLSSTDNGTIKQSGAKSNIVLAKDQLASQIYISVYAYQFTQINIGVIVHRNGSNTSLHQIPLTQDNVQTYTLNKTQPTAYFKFNSKNAAEITVFLNELSGYIDMSILNPSGDQVKCDDSNTDNRLVCKFTPLKNLNYSVKVTGDIKQQNTFTITYKTQKRQCFSGKLNQPLYVTLSSRDVQCFSFNINRQVSAIFAASFTHLQLFDKQITTSLFLNLQLYQTIQTLHKVITTRDMVNVCPMGLSIEGFPKTCELTIAFQSNIDSASYFSFVMEEEDAEIALFDGINQKIKGESIQFGNAKNFYYPVSSAITIQFFFTTRSLKSHYFLAAKFISKQTFLSRNNISNYIYLPYVSQIDRIASKPQQNYFSAVLGEASLQRVAIDSPDIKYNCPQLDCYLIISIYPQQFSDSISSDEDEYEIEVTQRESYLTLGDSKIGMLNKGELYTYLVDPWDATIQFTQINANGINSICLSASGALANGTVVKSNQFRSDLQVLKADRIEKIYVRGEKDHCSFEIRYISNVDPFQTARLSHPYDISVQNGETVRFLYNHQSQRSFRVVQMVSAGEPSIFIMPIRESNFTLTSLNSLSYSSFPSFNQTGGQYAVESSSLDFCWSCYYYVVVTTKDKYVGQVVFLRNSDPIPLTTNHILHQRLALFSKQSEQYIHYSLTTFSLTFNLQSGKLNITITDPAGTTVAQQQIAQKTTFKVQSMVYTQKEKVQFYSDKTKFKITAAAISQAEFYIQVNRNQVSYRIFEGYPSTVFIETVMSQTIEFINTQPLDAPLNVMVDLEQPRSSDAVLSFTVSASAGQGKTLTNDQLLRNVTKSDSTYVVALNNYEARYFLAVHTNVAVNVTLLLAKASLTHLSPKRNYLFQQEGIYQVYSANKNLLVEIFNCQGEVSLIGSKEAREVAFDYVGESAIAIKRPNYGGHYVFGLQAHFPSYYVRVNSKNKQSKEQLEYLVNYYYYEESNPYDAVDAPNYDLSYQIGKDGINLSVNQPAIIDSSNITIVKIVYSAYATASKSDLQRYSRCSIGTNVYQKTSQDTPNIVIESQTVNQLMQNNTDKLYITVQAAVTITTVISDASIAPFAPHTLTIFYNNIQISMKDVESTVVYVQPKLAYWITDSLFLFVGWIILLLVMVLVVPYLLVVACVRRLMMRQQDMAEEVELGYQNQTKPTEEKITDPSADPGNIPQFSSQPIIKEQI